MNKSLLKVSILTISGLYILLSAVIILLSYIIGGEIIYGIIISIAILILQFIISPYITDLVMKWCYKANFEAEIPDYLKNYINAICQKENMTYPKIGIIEDGAPNSFTYGHVKNDARIIITRGIFNLLTPEEVIAVVGHEMGHAVHYDMLFMTVAQLVPLVLYLLYESFRNSLKSRGRKKNSSGALIGMIITYVLYIIANYIVLWLSRTREYYADSYSIETTGNPNSLASALVKVGYGLTTAKGEEKKHSATNLNALGIFDSKTSKSLVITSYDNGVISREKIQNAMKWEQWNIWAKWFEFNSTHPLISKRLLAISAKSPAYNQEPFITFNLQKPESYVDDFLVEVIINFLPEFVAFISMIIFFILMVAYFSKEVFLWIPIALALITVTSYIKFNRKRPDFGYQKRTVQDLLGEVKVSAITAIPCELEGYVIGRGNPGYIFNEDMIIQDPTGIIFLDYNQPIFIMNLVFALFKNKEMAGKPVKVKGWYRRSPVPYVEIKTYEVDGVEKTIYTYSLTKAIYYILFIVEVIMFIGLIFM